MYMPWYSPNVVITRVDVTNQIKAEEPVYLSDNYGISSICDGEKYHYGHHNQQKSPSIQLPVLVT